MCQPFPLRKQTAPTLIALQGRSQESGQITYIPVCIHRLIEINDGLLPPGRLSARKMTEEDSRNSNLLAELLRCETGVWDALVTGDQKADADALDSCFLGVYPDDFAGKEDHVGQLTHGPAIESYELSDHRVLELGDEHAVLSYRASFTRRSQSKPESMYVSSIWRRQGEGWINIFSQDTSAVTD